MGGIWNTITGKDSRRQKRNYNASLDRYNNFAREAQNNIENLSRNLQQSMMGLAGLERKKYYHESQGNELQNHVSNYERDLKNLEYQKSNIAGESDKLKQAFESFKSKAPVLEGKMSEVEQLPNIFQSLYDKVSKQKEALRGLSEEEASIQIKKHHQDVETLKTQREETEGKIRDSMNLITRDHENLKSEKINLENRLNEYNSKANRLLWESNNSENSRSQLEKIIKDYKNAQDRITNDYTKHQSHTETLGNQLRDYASNAQTQLDAYGRDVEWNEGKYRQGAKLTGLAQGLGLAALTYGIGAGIGKLGSSALPWSMKASVLGSVASGVKALAPVIGIGHYMNASNVSNKLGRYEMINLTANNQNQDLSEIAKYGLGSPKISIPELGGLKQSLEHFNMKTVPQLKDLPKLHESLGKIVSLKDIESLTLGLPRMISASGKKYNHEVLYNPDFLKKLKKVSRNLGMPYFKSNIASRQNMGGSNIQYG